MRYALIDNATLVGIQRLLGEIPSENRLSTDMDMVCLESLVQGILFYDEVFILEERSQRLAPLAAPAAGYMTRLKLSDDIVASIDLKVKEDLHDIVPRISGGQFTNDEFKNFFNLMTLNVMFTWDCNDSVKYLVENVIAEEIGFKLSKYEKLYNAIKSEILDRRESQGTGAEMRDVVVDRVINQGFFSKPFVKQEEYAFDGSENNFFAGLAWLVKRTIFFSHAAELLSADLIMHPIRHAFHISWLAKRKIRDPSFYARILASMQFESRRAISNIISATQPAICAAELPMFSAWLVRQTGDPKYILEAATKLREDARIVQAREAFIELDMLANANPSAYVKQANAILKNLEKALHSVKVDFNIENSQGSVLATLIKVVNFGAALNGIRVAIPADLFKSKIINQYIAKHQHRYASPLYRDVVTDLASVSRLGSLYEKLGSRVVLK